jgi:hypothetical protein
LLTAISIAASPAKSGCHGIPTASRDVIITLGVEAPYERPGAVKHQDLAGVEQQIGREVRQERQLLELLERGEGIQVGHQPELSIRPISPDRWEELERSDSLPGALHRRLGQAGRPLALRSLANHPIAGLTEAPTPSTPCGNRRNLARCPRAGCSGSD